MARHCPVCGKSEGMEQFFGELCAPCEKKRMAPLPAIRITVCQKCGSVLDKARNRKQASFSDEAVRLLKLKGKNATLDREDCLIEYEMPFGKVTQAVEILESSSICTICGRAGTQYFEAIIQLRGGEKRVQKMSERLFARLCKTTFVPKVEELREGIDIYCGSRNEAIAALNAFSLGFLRTEKLAGQRDGKRLYRTTLLVRLG